jgi:PAS domain S-box-containing protein
MNKNNIFYGSICFIFLIVISLFLVNPCPAFEKTLRVGIYQNSPKVFVDKDGKPKGIFVDIVDEIARVENWKIDYVYGTWAENLERLENNEIEMLVDVSFSSERAKRFILNRTPVLESWLDIYSKRTTRIKSIRELNMKKIAVLEESVQEEYLHEEIKKAFKIDFTLLLYPDYSSSVKAVKSGAADVMVATRFFSFSTVRDENIVPLNVIFRVENLYFAFSKNISPEVVEAFDRNIAKMKNSPDSAYYQSLKHWLNMEPRPLIPVYIKWTLAIITGLLTLIGLCAFFLRRQVKAKTLALIETHRLLKETQSIAALGGWEYNVQNKSIKWTDEVYRIYGVDFNYNPDDIDLDISFYAPQSRPVIKKAFQLAVEKGKPYDLELELIRADGECIWVRTTSQPVMENGKVVRVTGNIMNITDAKRAEAEKQKLQNQLAIAQKMELVGQLAGGVAHDFNNILGVILGYAELARMKIKPSDTLYADIEEIKKAAERSSALTHQLLAFARKQNMAPKVLDLNETVEGMLKMLRRLIGEDISLDWLPKAGLWSVKIDPAQVDQILANLCVNARYAIADVGKITIETENVAFDKTYCADNVEFIPGKYVMLAVSDDGCGMDKDILKKIFEPFFTTKEVGQGTGLGLSTVYGIVKQNNGFINVYSETGKGTTFKIYLPRNVDESVKVEEEIATEIPRGYGETVLIVEDDPAILKLVEKILDELGYTVLTADSPDKAIRLVKESKCSIHLLITDVIMPKINGRELETQIKAICPGIKCLFMSGYTANIIANRGVLDEGVQFIQKPFSIKDLAAKVRTMLDKN